MIEKFSTEEDEMILGLLRDQAKHLSMSLVSWNAVHSTSTLISGLEPMVHVLLKITKRSKGKGKIHISYRLTDHILCLISGRTIKHVDLTSPDSPSKVNAFLALAKKTRKETKKLLLLGRRYGR